MRYGCGSSLTKGFKKSSKTRIFTEACRGSITDTAIELTAMSYRQIEQADNSLTIDSQREQDSGLHHQSEHRLEWICHFTWTLIHLPPLFWAISRHQQCCNIPKSETVAEQKGLLLNCSMQANTDYKSPPTPPWWVASERDTSFDTENQEVAIKAILPANH